MGRSRDYSPLVLLVDDDATTVTALTALLQEFQYRVLHAGMGGHALDLLWRERPDVVLLDHELPDISGFEVCERIKRDLMTRHIPVIMLAKASEHAANVRALRAGADDFLTHPINPELLDARLHSSVRAKSLEDQIILHQQRLKDHNVVLEEAVSKRTAELERAYHVTAFSLAKLAESRDPETGQHLERMRRYVCELSIIMGSWEKYESVIDSAFMETIYYASPLHDIGKVGIPDFILLKPGKLSDDEFGVMKTHTMVGGDTLKAANDEAGGSSFLEMGCEIAYFHHEKWNGQGYPFGRSGDEIPLAARIVALGDAYDALTTKRPYKEAFSHEKSRDIIVEAAGEHFDPDVVDAFLAREAKFIRIQESFAEEEVEEPVVTIIPTVQSMERAQAAV